MSDINADPANTTAHRLAKRAVIVLTALIILAMIGLVVAVIWRVSAKSPHPLVGGPSAAAVVLPPGTQIVSSQAESGRLILHLRNRGVDEIAIYSLDDGHLVARFSQSP